MLSRRTKYAIHSLLALAVEPERALGTQALQERCGGSRPYLEAVLSTLAREGLVTSIRGRSGGFRLARRPEQISFAEVIRLFEGPLALAPCASQTDYRRCDDCLDEASCGIRHALIEARDRVAAVLEHTTLANAYSAGTVLPSLAREIAAEPVPEPFAEPFAELDAALAADRAANVR